MTTPDLDAVVLPPLPATRMLRGRIVPDDSLVMRLDDVEAYATAAVLADRERRVDDTKRLEWLARWAGNPRVVQVLVCTVRNDLTSLRVAIDAARTQGDKS